MQETYFIKLKDDSNGKHFEWLVAFLEKNGARIVITSAQRLWIVAAMNQQLANDIRRRPFVKAMGGVSFRKREVRVIRIQKNLA